MIERLSPDHEQQHDLRDGVHALITVSWYLFREHRDGAQDRERHESVSERSRFELPA